MIDYSDRIKDSEAAVLSYISLGGDISKLDSKLIRRELSLSLLKSEKGQYVLSEDSYPLLSLYPLLGRNCASRHFESHLIPFILAAINEGYISSEESKIRTYFNSDYFTTLFPSGRNYSASAIMIVKSLQILNVVKTINGRLYLKYDRTLEFSNLDLISKLGYILRPELEDGEREKLVKALFLLSKLRDIPDIDKAFMLIKSISGFDLSDDIESLLTIGLLYKEDDSYYGSDLNRNKCSDGVVSSDFTLSYSGFCDENLFLFLKPVKSDTISQWILEKDTLRSAFSHGLKPEDVISSLSRVSKYPLADTLLSRINSWYEQFKMVAIMRGVLLVTDEKNSRILDNLPLLKRHIISKPAENVFILNPESELEWRKILSYSGYDMLADTTGPEFKEEKIDKPLLNIEFCPAIPNERAIPFDEKKYNQLILDADSDLDRLLYRYGVFDLKQISFVEGLYFQEKLRVITDAISKERYVLIEDIDNKVDIVLPLSVTKIDDDKTILSTDNGEYIVDKLWRVAILPELALNTDEI